MENTDKLCKHISALIKAMGMLAENKQRELNGEALAYDEKSFTSLIEDLEAKK